MKNELPNRRLCNILVAVLVPRRRGGMYGNMAKASSVVKHVVRAVFCDHMPLWLLRAPSIDRYSLHGAI